MPDRLTPGPTPHLQRQAITSVGTSTAVSAEGPLVVQEVLSSPGQALDEVTRSLMESRFGYDFSKVRVHTDSRAAESARAVNALAYTAGHDIVFGAGQYAPHSREGQKLLSHELAHVAQQAGTSPGVGDLERLRMSTPSDPAEREADQVAERATGAGPAIALATLTAFPSMLARQVAGEPAPTKAEEQLDARLNRLAVFPGEALKAWKGLKPADQTLVVGKMLGRYGADFANDFLQYAAGKKKPNLSLMITNLDDPKSLQARGYRQAPAATGVPLWVHPSGHEIFLLSPPSKAAPTPSPSAAKPSPTPSPTGPEPEPEPKDKPDPVACATVCKAFASMQRAAQRLCDLAGQDDQRCVEAKTKVEQNEKRVEVCGCKAQ